MTYPSIGYAADAVVFAAIDAQPRPTHVLLIQRDWPPFAGAWALPGGYVERTESGGDAAVRELREETGLDVTRCSLAGVDPVGVWDAPDRDPRGRVVTVAWTAVVDRLWPVTGADDARAAEWVPLRDTSGDPWSWSTDAPIADGRLLAFDHESIVRAALPIATAHIVR